MKESTSLALTLFFILSSFDLTKSEGDKKSCNKVSK